MGIFIFHLRMGSDLDLNSYLQRWKISTLIYCCLNMWLYIYQEGAAHEVELQLLIFCSSLEQAVKWSLSFLIPSPKTGKEKEKGFNPLWYKFP